MFLHVECGPEVITDIRRQIWVVYIATQSGNVKLWRSYYHMSWASSGLIWHSKISVSKWRSWWRSITWFHIVFSHWFPDKILVAQIKDWTMPVCIFPSKWLRWTWLPREGSLSSDSKSSRTSLKGSHMHQKLKLVIIKINIIVIIKLIIIIKWNIINLKSNHTHKEINPNTHITIYDKI